MFRRCNSTTNIMIDWFKTLWNGVNGVSEHDFFMQQGMGKDLEAHDHCSEIDYNTRLEEELELELELQNRTLKNSEKDVHKRESEDTSESQ